MCLYMYARPIYMYVCAGVDIARGSFRSNLAPPLKFMLTFPNNLIIIDLPPPLLLLFYLAPLV